MADWLAGHGARLVVCAGYMHLLTTAFLDRFPHRVINVHPSLLPAFPGTHAVADALAAGVAETGVTVHQVDEGIDTGPVILQESVQSWPATLPPRCSSVCMPSSTVCCHARLDNCSARVYVRPNDPARAPLGLRQDRARPTRTRSGRARSRAPRKRRNGRRARTARDRRDGCRDGDGLPRAPRREGEDPPPAHARRHPRPTKPRGRPGGPHRAWHRADRPRLRQPLPVRSGRVAEGHPRGGRGRDDRHRRARDAAGGGEELPDVVPLCSPSQYGQVLAELEEKGDSDAGDPPCAGHRGVCGHTAAYEASITAWFAEREAFPDRLVASARKELDSHTARTPISGLPTTARSAPAATCLSTWSASLGAVELSFNNLNDLAAARSLLEAVLASGLRDRQARESLWLRAVAAARGGVRRALASDPVSRVRWHRRAEPSRRRAARRAARRQFVEVLFAPGFAATHLRCCARSRRPHPRQRESRSAAPAGARLPTGARRDARPGSPTRRSRHANRWRWSQPLTLRTRMGRPPARAGASSSTSRRTPSSSQTISPRSGSAPGQMSRVDAVRIAVEKAREHGHDLQGAGPRVGRVLPVPRWAEARTRRRDRRDHPAGRLETRRRGDRRGRARGCCDGFHPPAAFPPLIHANADNLLRD